MRLETEVGLLSLARSLARADAAAATADADAVAADMTSINGLAIVSCVGASARSPVRLPACLPACPTIRQSVLALRVGL